MPYDVSDSQPDCKGWATVKKNRDGSLETIGCHRTKKEAIAQMVAVSIATEHERTRVVAQARGLMVDAELALVEIAHRRLQLRYNPDQPRDPSGKWTSGGGDGGGDPTLTPEIQAIRDAPMVQPSKDERRMYNRMHDDAVDEAKRVTSDIEGLDEAKSQWTSAGWKHINGAIGDDGTVTLPARDPIHRDVAALDQAISRCDEGVLQSMYGGDREPVVLYRGATNLKDAQIGDEIHNRGYMSTSVSPLTAMEFSVSAGGVLSMDGRKNEPVLAIKNVQHGLPIGGGELEVLLPRGMKLRIAGRRTVSNDNGDTEVIEAEIIDHGVTDGGGTDE